MKLKLSEIEAAMEEARVFQHLPNGRVTPIVRNLLRVDLNLEVVVTTSEHAGTREHLVDVEAEHVSAGVLERILESLLVFFGLTLAVGDHASTVANEDEHTALVRSIERGDIRDRVRVEEDEREVSRIEALVGLRLEESLDIGALEVIDGVGGPLVEIMRHLFRVLVVSDGLSTLHVGRHCVVVLQILSSSELLHHDHLVLAHLGSNLKQLVLLLLLGQVDDVGPALLVLSLEALEEFIE